MQKEKLLQEIARLTESLQLQYAKNFKNHDNITTRLGFFEDETALTFQYDDTLISILDYSFKRLSMWDNIEKIDVCVKIGKLLTWQFKNQKCDFAALKSARKLFGSVTFEQEEFEKIHSEWSPAIAYAIEQLELFFEIFFPMIERAQRKRKPIVFNLV